MDPQTTTTSTSDETQGETPTDSGATGTELRVPITSETASDQPILRPSEPTDTGLIIGIVVIVIVVIGSAVTVVVIVGVIFKRRGNMVESKKRALSNPMYSTNGQ